MNEKVKERSEQTDRNRKWPWDWRNEVLTDTASKEIVKNLALYANDAVYRKPEEVGMSDSLDVGFLSYCFHVKENFIKAAKKYPKSKVSEIAEEVFRLIDRFVSIVEHPTKDNTCSWLKLISQWETVVLNFDVFKSSGEQQEQQAETRGNTTHAKIINIENFKGVLGDIQAENVQTGDYASIHKKPTTAKEKKGILIRLLKIIGAIIVGIIGSLIAAILIRYFW